MKMKSRPVAPRAGSAPHVGESAKRYDRAVALLQAGKVDEALSAYDAILAGSPQHVDALGDSAIALVHLGRPTEALERMRAAVALAPRVAGMQWNLGMLLGQMGRIEEAVAAFTSALSLDASSAAWWTELGNAQLAAQHPEAALAAFDQALRRNPREIGALANRALALRALLRADEAEAACRAALAVAPDRVDALSNLGLMLMEAGRDDEAEVNFARAHQLAPDNAAVRANRCNLLLRNGRRGEALALALAATQAPDATDKAWTMLAHAQLEYALYDDALQSCNRALSIAPTNATAQFSRGIVLLGLGRCEQGFEDYEARRRIDNQVVQARRPEGAEWDGGALDGRTILLTAEQGAGDAFHFVRYAALVKARGAHRVIVEALPSLCDILATAPGVDAVVSTAVPYPPYDVHAPLCSLPRLMGTRLDAIPANVPYLSAPALPIQGHVRDKQGLRVGLVWNGNPRQNRNRIRNVPFALLLDALDMPGVQLFSLQVGSTPEPALDAAVAAGRVIDLAPELRTFAETAAAVDACDVMVSIDTSVAHLAGALGRPTCTLLPVVPDWRWLHHRTDSPWYPTMRLFRQRDFDDWSVPIAEVRQYLVTLLTASGDPDARHAATAAHYQRGLTLRAQREDAGALSELRAAVASDATSGAAWLELARCLAATGKHTDAEPAYDRALALDPRNATIISDRAVTLRNLMRHDEAIAACRDAVALDPSNGALHSNLGVFLKEVRRIDEAERAFTDGLQHAPDHPLLLQNLASLCHESVRLADAESLCARLIEVHPSLPGGFTLRGCLHMEYGRYDEASADLRRALVLDPGNATAEWNLACLRLLTGDLAGGFRGLERRQAVSGFISQARDLAGVPWRGELLKGQTILVHEEQGIGDVLQFARYAKELKARGAGRVIIETSQDAARLVSTIPGVDEVTVRGAPLPAFDLFVPLMSLPHWCGTNATTIPADVPYVCALPRPCASLVEQAPGVLKVGLVWGGNPQHARDRYRSAPFAALLSAVQMDGVTLFSLQKGPHARALAPWRAVAGVIDLDPQLTSLDDTAAALMALDLVISVDTSVAHLAGALGRPVWTIHPLLPDWRWGREGDRSPWYPTMRLFRQDGVNDWSRPLGQVRNALQAALAQRTAR